MIDNTIIVEIDMPNEIDVDLGDAKFITAPEKQVPQAVPQIDVDNNGLITATSVQEAGSVRAGTTKSIYQLAVEQGKTISPSGESQVAIEKGRFAVGDIVVSPLKVQEKELNVTDSGNYEVVPDNDYLLSRVGINVDISAKVDEAFRLGAKSEYDRFWDACQDYGNRNVYSYFCYYQNRVGDYFYPKYDIRPRLADYFMRDAKMYGNETTLDFAERLKECGVVFDVSNCTNILYLFYNARVSHLPELDVRKATTGANSLLFGNCVETIDNFITDETQLLDNAFGYAASLVNIKFGGIVGKNIKMSDCKKLSHESIMNLFNALKNFSGTATTQTCTLGEANLAKLTDTEKAIATEKGWSLA